MTQYPGNGQPYAPSSYDQPSQAPAKTSVLAILSLVFAMLCLTSPLALIFGGLAIVLISRSNGRTKGLGLAIAGTVIGLIFSTLLIVVVVGMAQANKAFATAFAAPIGGLVQDIESGDVAKTRTMFSSSLNAATTDEEIKAFNAEVKTHFGAYKTYPGSIIEFIGKYTEIAPQMQGLQPKLNSQAGILPIPMEFDNGIGLVLIQFSQNGGTATPPSGVMLPPLDRYGIYVPATDTIIWIDEAGDQTDTTTTP